MSVSPPFYSLPADFFTYEERPIHKANVKLHERAMALGLVLGGGRAADGRFCWYTPPSGDMTLLYDYELNNYLINERDELYDFLAACWTGG